MDGTTPPASRREIAKAERRARIVDATAALVREHGFEAVSMVQIAQRAELAPATLYNLFQTKGAIFRQLFDLDLAAYQRMVEEAPTNDALDRIFVAIDVAASLYERDPLFYRAMAHLGGEGAKQLSAAISRPRTAFYQAQVAAAVAEGRLRADTDADLLGGTLSQLMGGIFLEWAAGIISPRRLAAEASYGFATVLRAFATPETATSLTARFNALQDGLATNGRDGSDA